MRISSVKHTIAQKSKGTAKELEIISEEKDFIAVNKPAGLLVHRTLSTKKSEAETLADYIAGRYPETRGVGDDPQWRPGIVHRLDKDTSGVLIIARTQNFFQHFKGLLQKGEVKKEYRALVLGTLAQPKIISKPIGLISGSVRRSTRARAMKMIKPAVTEAYPERWFDHKGMHYTLVRAIPKTGRTHQIRVHLTSIGHPIAGDALYGGKARKGGISLPHHFLHAEAIEFRTEEGKRIRIEAELPEELAGILRELGKCSE